MVANDRRLLAERPKEHAFTSPGDDGHLINALLVGHSIMEALGEQRDAESAWVIQELFCQLLLRTQQAEKK